MKCHAKFKEIAGGKNYSRKISIRESSWTADVLVNSQSILLKKSSHF